MASLSSVTREFGRLGQGGIIQVIKGIMPSAATADVTVGEITSSDKVTVVLTDPVSTDTIPMIEVVASRTTGTAGSIVVGTQDGSSVPATANVTIEIKRLVI